MQGKANLHKFTNVLNIRDVYPPVPNISVYQSEIWKIDLICEVIYSDIDQQPVFEADKFF